MGKRSKHSAISNFLCGRLFSVTKFIEQMLSLSYLNGDFVR